MSNSIYDHMDEDDSIESYAPLKKDDNDNNNENKKGSKWVVVLVIIGLLGIGFMCNHAAEEAEKLDTFTNYFIGTIIFGLTCLCIYFYSKSK